ncbi:MAG TPA: response regulator transcription factor [Vicinamibacterales bacterium]|nr:response regulator transcription factor [Vicinamibacterales bacterium]
MDAIRILLADDHETVRQGLRLLLERHPEMQVVAEAGDGEAAVQRAEQVRPDVVVMDITMPGMNGLQATRRLREALPAIGIVVLSRHRDSAYLQEMLHAGAQAYVLKQSASAELIRAVRAAAAGQQYLDANVAQQLTGEYLRRHTGRSARQPGLSERELDVLRLMAWGLSNKEIAARLDLSIKTIEVHKSNAMRKLNLHGRVDIVRYALLQGWLQEM